MQVSPDQALKQYESLLERNPRHFDALQGAGILLAKAGRFQDAHLLFARACEVQPRNFMPHFYHGLALQGLKRHHEALASYDRALSLKPDLAGVYNNRGNVLRDLQRYHESLASFDKALWLKPHFAEAHANRGNVLRDLRRLEESLASYDQALCLNDELAEAHNNRGITLSELHRYDESLASFDTALALKADYAEVHNNRGNVLRELQRYDEALAGYATALSIRADYAEAHSNRGTVLSGLHRYDDALASYDHAIGLDPNFPDARYYKAMLLLLLGRFAEGWRLHEWRWKTDQSKWRLKDFRQPLWLGAEPLPGKTLLLHAEQGLGDAIQFARYVSLVEALGANVVLQVPAPLVALFRTLAGKFTLVSEGDALPPFDLHCPLMSLPLAFGTTVETIPAPPAYLSADPERRRQWAQRVGEHDGLRVGLVWAGSQVMRADRRRSLPLASFAVLGEVPDVQFVSLQLGPASAQLAQVRQARWDGPEIADFTNDILDWADTAALVDHLDLVIACDTGTAHLAAAMGKPTWILNRYDSCWRWLAEREDSPWYPSVRLFRQPKPGDWDSVLSRVKAELVREATLR